MKIIKRKIFTYFIKSTLFRAVYLFVFLIHFFSGHTFLNSYILCYEENGKVTLESLAEQQQCCKETVVPFLSFDNINNDEHCKDISITGNCEEDNSRISIKSIYKLFPQQTIQYINSGLNLTNNYSAIVYSEKSNISPQLDSFKTISLLI